jgi:hypothetical protein
MGCNLVEFFSLMEDDLASVTKEGVKAFAVARQSSRAKKRAFLGDSSLALRAIDAFVSINNSVGHSSIRIDPDIARDARAFVTHALERYSTTASELNIQVTLDYVHLLDLWRFGPGASFDTKGTHAADKIGQAWSVTSPAIPVVKRLRRNNAYFAARDSSEQSMALNEVRGSRLSTVPKNEEKERTIAIEPLGNMCIQLAAGEYLAGALRSIGLDIRFQQERNKVMARLGSITNQYGTLDLSNASDMIHPDLVRLLLPPEWVDLLMAIRSPETLLPNGEWVKLNMISTMGNGFTFPLMTLLIVALIYGFRSQAKGSPNLWVNWDTACVFGDDIVLPTHELMPFTKVLEDSGLVVNYDKSYFDGPFRESCGGDYYEGVDVTPFYVKTLGCDADIYVALNKMSEWGGKVGVHLYQATEYLFRNLSHRPCFVPEWEQPTAGFRCTQVDRRYRKLTPVNFRKKLKDEFFLMPLACAGYVTGGPHGPLYMPRPVRVRYRVVRSRLPNGYLVGWDHGFRDSPVSSHCDFVAWLGSVVFLTRPD